jgi:YD repeat-containing protein
METTRTYNLLSLLESESYSGTGAVLDDYSVEYDYDDYGRRTRVGVKDNGFSKNKITYGYDTDTGRREWIINGVYKAKYGYASNSSLISSIEFYNGSTRKMTSLKDYDFLNRTISVDSEIESSGKHIGFGYQYNLASQRTQILREDGSHWKYGYDSLGQVISGQRYWSDGTRVIGQQFGYDYDDIGNRIHSYAGGDADGSNMRATGYTHTMTSMK